jgi:hypothetical protein
MDRIIVMLLGNGIRKAARRICLSKYNVSKGIAAFLARHTRPENSFDIGVVDPWHQNRSRRMDNYNGIIVSISNSIDLLDKKMLIYRLFKKKKKKRHYQFIAVMPQIKIDAIAKVAFNSNVAFTGISISKHKGYISI